VLILADDLGFSDIGCYGGEIRTPNLDALAAKGVRFSQFYNTARCSPSRASLLTGLHPHTTGVGILAKDDRPGGYPGSLNDAGRTMAEIFRDAGYRTGLSGKWHLSANVDHPDASWPTRRGFDHFFGTIAGCGSYYAPGTLHRQEEPLGMEEYGAPGWFYTDAIAEDAADFIAGGDPAQPFFCYVAATAPHWPLHAPEDDITAYDGVYNAGWDTLREDRFARQQATGLLPAGSTLSARDPDQRPWSQVDQKAWNVRRMQTYAAMVDRLDRAVGRIVDALKAQGVYDDTIIAFLSDNGGCAEELPMGDTEEFKQRTDIYPHTTRSGRAVQLGNVAWITPGPEDTYTSYGQAWANLSNTPFRLYKRWVHEGGIATPLIVRWGGLEDASITHDAYQLTDLLPTLLELTGIGAPPDRQLPGVSAAPSLRGLAGPEHDLFWEHIGNCAMRRGSLKLVKETHGEWELYDLSTDRAEMHDLAAERPDEVKEMAERWQAWADEVGVLPWQATVVAYLGRGLDEDAAMS
jgi:arylsulfatase